MFETVSTKPRRNTTMALSITLHVGLASSLAVGQVLAVQDTPERDDRRIEWFHLVKAPPPVEPVRIEQRTSGYRGDPNGGSPVPKRLTFRAPAVTQPRVVPELSILSPSSGETFVRSNSVEKTDDEPIGIGSGIKKTIGEIPGPAGPVIRAASAPEVTPPVAVFNPDPNYPESMRRARVQGIVILEAVIGTDGAV